MADSFDNSTTAMESGGGGGRVWSSSVDVDTATIVSITSSCVILISGCIAVICLILYMKKSDSMLRYRNALQMSQMPVTCAKCGANVMTTTTTTTDDQHRAGMLALQQQQHTTTTTAAAPMVTRGGGGGGKQQQQQQTHNKNTTTTTTSGPLYAISSTDLGKIKRNDSLLGFICGHISDPTVTYAMSACSVSQMKARPTMSGQQSQQQMQSQSQCSSNHDELIGAYEFAQKHREAYECDIYESIGSEGETPTDPGIREFTKSPPKPNERRQGVVQHTTTGGSSRMQSSDDSSSDSTTTTAQSQSHFGAIPRHRSRKPMWKLCSQSDTIKADSLVRTKISGLSSDDESVECVTPAHTTGWQCQRVIDC